MNGIATTKPNKREERFDPALERAMQELDRRMAILDKTSQLSEERFAEEYAREQFLPDDPITDHNHVRGE